MKISPASHGLVIGGTGTGKYSTFLLNEMLQHIELDLGGLIAIDPHGELIIILDRTYPRLVAPMT